MARRVGQCRSESVFKPRVLPRNSGTSPARSFLLTGASADWESISRGRLPRGRGGYAAARRADRLKTLADETGAHPLVCGRQ